MGQYFDNYFVFGKSAASYLYKIATTFIISPRLCLRRITCQWKCKPHDLSSLLTILVVRLINRLSSSASDANLDSAAHHQWVLGLFDKPKRNTFHWHSGFNR